MGNQVQNLWGEEFEVKDETSELLSKLANPKTVKVSPVKILKSKTISLIDKLKIITSNVYKILAKRIDESVILTTREQLHSYIDTCIRNKVVAIDTETNNSLDPITCKLMGLCLYTPNQKAAYIPVNHVDVYSRHLLPNQVTEEDIRQELERVKNIDIIMHNGKFDYEVLKCTCNVEVPITWDTLVGARLLNENESAGLKEQYVSKIDPEQEKYSIENLFSNIEYAVVDPNVFSLYAATDSYMTYRLYEYQKEIFLTKGNERLYKLFKEIEVPMIIVTASMELSGVEIDLEFSKRLKLKFDRNISEIDKKISQELYKYSKDIDNWRTSKDALSLQGKKTKGEQLENPINLASPLQLSIFFYDILKIPPVNPKKPRSVGKEELTIINERYKLELASLILERRGLVKLVDTFIETLPQSVNPKDHRLHAHFNQLGTDTGRFSSSEPNLQNIPSKEKSIRKMFKARTEYKDITIDDFVELDKFTKVKTTCGWKYSPELSINDILLLKNELGVEISCPIKNVEINDVSVKIFFSREVVVNNE